MKSRLQSRRIPFLFENINYTPTAAEKYQYNNCVEDDQTNNNRTAGQQSTLHFSIIAVL